MTLDEQLARAFDTLTARLQHDVAREVRSAADELAASARIEVPPAPARDTIVAAQRETTARLTIHIRTIAAVRSLGGVLDALVAAAGASASRVALVLVRDGRLRGSRLRGFAPTLDAASIDVSVSDAGIVGLAAKQSQVVTASADHDVDLPAFARGGAREQVALPIVLGGQVVAVMYVDGLTEPSGALEVLTDYAARCAESIIAMRAATALATPPNPVGSEAVQQAAADRGSDDRLAAQRYARLLVSEIRLYHQDEVDAGRRERDLAMRLGGEIARARRLYEERVPADIRRDADYFDAEVVRTLAQGDESLFTSRSRA